MKGEIKKSSPIIKKNDEKNVKLMNFVILTIAIF